MRWYLVDDELKRIVETINGMRLGVRFIGYPDVRGRVTIMRWVEGSRYIITESDVLRRFVDPLMQAAQPTHWMPMPDTPLAEGIQRPAPTRMITFEED